MKYQTRIRRSADTVWPLRRASGETWVQRPPVVDRRECATQPPGATP